MTATKPKFRPIGDHAVIRRDEAPDKTSGGIVIPDQAKATPIIGTVVAVGPGYYREGEYVPLEIKVGDRVVFPTFVGQPVEIDGEKYSVVKESELLSVLEEE
jgi:chaperonin GroES